MKTTEYARTSTEQVQRDTRPESEAHKYLFAKQFGENMSDLYHDPIFYLKTNAWKGDLKDVDAYEKIKSRSVVDDPIFIVLESWYTTLGKGCDQNISLAIELLEKDAVQKNAVALCAAGLGFLRGHYGKPDEDIALSYFDKAEKICARKANYQKGLIYYNRFIIKRNDRKTLIMASNYFEKAARNGHATSLSMLAFCRTRSRSHALFKYFFSTLISYLFARRHLGGPERWWCYRDLTRLRPSTVQFAENCGHALGYFSEK